MDNQTNKEIGILMRKYRQKLGLTLRDAAKITGYTSQAFSFWEFGRSTITLKAWSKFKWTMPNSMQKEFEKETKAILTK